MQCVLNTHWVLEFLLISLWKIPLSQKMYASAATDASDKYEVWMHWDALSCIEMYELHQLGELH